MKKNKDIMNMIGYSSYDNVVQIIILKIKTEYDLYIPLNFWFCRDRGLALPIIALTKSRS